MRILKMALINYVGIYNGLGLYEICIDFSKCKNRIVVIKGDNGSGKSTLLNALTPFPDGNINFIPGKRAEKYITISSADIIYQIRCIHDVKKDGTRDTAKAYLEKISPTGNEELNPNGNIGSFKDVLEYELALDSNFIALSKLSGEDKGLVDKTPAERKRFISAIMTNLETYNSINKKMNKLYTVYKSMIGTITNKIDYIGDEAVVRRNLSSINNRIAILEAQKDSAIASSSSCTAKITLLDPDGEVQEKYKALTDKIVELQSERSRLESILTTSTDGLTGSRDDLVRQYGALQSTISNKKQDILRYEDAVNKALDDRETRSKTLMDKSNELQHQDMEDIDALEEKAIIYSNNLKSYADTISKMGIDVNNVTADEYILGVNTLVDIQDAMNTFKANLSYALIQEAIDYSIINSYPDIDSISIEIDNCKRDIATLDKDIDNCNRDIVLASSCKCRPRTCNIDDCAFIRDAIIVAKTNPEARLLKLQAEYDSSSSTLRELVCKYNATKDLIDAINTLRTVIRLIKSNILILNKLPVSDIFADIKSALYHIVSNSRFSDTISKMKEYATVSNVITLYKSTTVLLQDVNDRISKCNKILDEYNTLIDEINRISKDIDIINDCIISNNTTIAKTKFDIEKLCVILEKIDIAIHTYDDIYNIDKNLAEIKSQLNTAEVNMKEIKDCLVLSAMATSSYNSAVEELSPLVAEKEKLNHGLNLLYEYKNELAIYQEKFKIVEVVRQYSSPSKEGIQKLFMQIYMGKTLEMANQLLSMIFDGQFVLQPYIINDNEFRIPCLGSGLINDDISSMSLSQRCMISMILSFVLLHQSSTKYNILKLDEIDAGLDYNSRIAFLNVLYRQMDMMNIEQTIIISHNSELSLEGCDVIVLKMAYDTINEGNIIYKYNNTIINLMDERNAF